MEGEKREEFSNYVLLKKGCSSFCAVQIQKETKGEEGRQRKKNVLKMKDTLESISECI